jgi:hypothetical protein
MRSKKMSLKEWKEIGNQIKKIIDMNNKFFENISDKIPKTKYSKEFLSIVNPFQN